MPTDIVIYAVIAVGLVLWLRGVLGTRNGSERQRPNPFATPSATEIVRPLTPGVTPVLPGTPTATGPVSLRQGLERNMSIANPQAEPGLMDIARADRAFDLAHFLHGAQDAFVMIVEAFAKADRATLRDLLSDRVYQSFSAVLDQRDKSGEKASVEIHALRHVDVTEARLDGRAASITIRFVADETYVLRDASGAVIQGNPDRVNEAVDIWVFTRDLRDRGVIWRLGETRDQDAPAAGNIILPDVV